MAPNFEKMTYQDLYNHILAYKHEVRREAERRQGAVADRVQQAEAILAAVKAEDEVVTALRALVEAAFTAENTMANAQNLTAMADAFIEGTDAAP